MTRYLWVAYFVTVGIFATVPSSAWVIMHVGPAVQWWWSPITGPQSIPPETVVRLDDGRLCWTRTLNKKQAATPWKFEVVLDRPWLGDRSFPEVRDRYTGDPYHTRGALPAGIYPKDQCIPLPALQPGEPIVLSQTIHYSGWLGWWDLPVPLPQVRYTAPP